jgi:hypothetical protein
MRVYFWPSPWNIVDISPSSTDNCPKYQNVKYCEPQSGTSKIDFLLDNKLAGNAGAKRKDRYEFKHEHLCCIVSMLSLS